MVRLPSKTLRQRGHRGATESCQEPPHALQKRLGLKARHAAPTAIGCLQSGLRGEDATA
jgi:hypothetical protein